MIRKSSFRWFAGAFVAGATLPLIVGMTGQIKNLKMQMGRATFEGASAWVALCVQCGACFGLLGLCFEALKQRRIKP